MSRVSEMEQVTVDVSDGGSESTWPEKPISAVPRDVVLVSAGQKTATWERKTHRPQ